MSLGDAPYGHIDHLLLELTDLYGPLEAIIITGRLSKYGEAQRSLKLNKWTLAYLAEEISRDYPGFDLFLVGYFGDGDGELHFGEINEATSE